MPYNYMKEYQNYRTEDFIHNEKFFNWVKAPTKESEKFWDTYIKANPEKAKDIELAVKIIRNSVAVEKKLSVEDIDQIWSNIQLNTSKSGSRRIKPVRYIAVAAGIAMLLVAGWFISQTTLFDRLDPDVADFFNPKASEEGNLVTIITTDGEGKVIDGTDPEIIYDNNGNLITQDFKALTQVQRRDKSQKIIYNQLIVPNGKRSTITLSDGTKIWINSGSRLMYPAYFNGPTREIFLTGEAYIEVAPEKSRLFIVNTPKMNVLVHGTVFNVSAYPEDQFSQVVLVEGKVKVKATKSKEVELAPDQLYQYSSLTGNTTLSDNINTYEFTSWKDGWLLCSNEELNSIFKKLSRYYDVEIVLKDSGAGMVKLSGKLDLKDSVEEVMKVVTTAAPIHYNISGNTIMVYRKGRE